MNLLSATMPATAAVLPPVTLSLRHSTGWAPGPTGKQQPAYAAPVSGQGSFQPMSQAALAKIDGLDQQGRYRRIYLFGQWFGVVRAAQLGGDFVTHPDGTFWLVVKEMEMYAGYWTSVLGCQQLAAPP